VKLLREIAATTLRVRLFAVLPAGFDPELPGYALAYEFYPGAESAMVQACSVRLRFRKLPVTVIRFPVGFNLKTKLAQLRAVFLG
jgi:hypothetical protein